MTLAEAVQQFCDEPIWRAFVEESGGTINALGLLNASGPTEPDDMNWGTAYTIAENHARMARYETARHIRNSFRQSLQAGQLLAFGVQPGSLEEVPIPPARWNAYWPMFATNRAVFRDHELYDLRVVRAEDYQTTEERLELWMRLEKATNNSLKKCALLHKAKKDFGCSDRAFETVYRKIFARKRGRARREAKNALADSNL